MRLPLELIRIILDHAKKTYTNEQYLALGLVHGVFQEEIWAPFFETIYPGRLVNSCAWRLITQGPNEQLLYYTITRHHLKPSLFTFLFTAVCERQFAKLGLVWTTEGRPRQLVLAWCRLAMHKHWGLEWAVENKTENVEAYIARYPVKCEFMQGFYDNDRELCARERLAKRHENDRMFLEIGSAIIDDDQDAVLDGFFGFCSGVDELNYCFGTTLLGLAVRSGTPDMLRLLLRSTRTVRRKHLYIYLELAMARPRPESALFTTILLSRLSGPDATAKKRFTTDLLEKAFRYHQRPLFDAIIHWVDTAPDNDAPPKLPIFEWAFKYLLWPEPEFKYIRHGRSHLLDRYLPYPAPRPPSTPNTLTTTPTPVIPPKPTTPVLTVLPAHHFGTHYHAHLLRARPTFVSFRTWSPRCYWSCCTQGRPPLSLTPVFLAAARGLVHWVDWLLRAGADPRHLAGDVALVDCAWSAGKRTEVAVLLGEYGWDVWRLEVGMEGGGRLVSPLAQCVTVS